MNKPEYQTYADGTCVRFTDQAREAMQKQRSGDTPLRTPAGGADSTYTIRNTDDSFHDVILIETDERWGVYWLTSAEAPAPRKENQ